MQCPLRCVTLRGAGPWVWSINCSGRHCRWATTSARLVTLNIEQKTIIGDDVIQQSKRIYKSQLIVQQLSITTYSWDKAIIACN